VFDHGIREGFGELLHKPERLIEELWQARIFGFPWNLGKGDLGRQGKFTRRRSG
jgi:hypothetical protein